MMAERYKLGDIDNERFYQVPKSLFINPKYKSMSNTSKIMYAILKDRMELSRKNKWNDENGDIYLLFSQDDMADLLSVNKSTIVRNMKELTDSHLIDSVRQGLGKPNKIYINHPERFQEVAKMRSSEYAKMPTLKNAQCNPNDTDSNDTENNDTKKHICVKEKKAPSNIYNLFDGRSKVLIEAWQGFVDMRKAKKKPMTERAAKMILKKLDKLSGGDEETQIAILDKSVVKCWSDVYELKEQYGTSKQKKQPTQADYEDLLRELENDDKQSGYCQADS